MRGTPSELGRMHSVCYSGGGVFTRMIACIILSSEYVLKIANSEDETCHFNIGQARSACLCFSKARCVGRVVSRSGTFHLLVSEVC